jgi:hypothetical protein
MFTMVSAFLVASYVGAHRLSPLMIALLIGMYAYAYFGIAFTLTRQMTTAFGLVGQISARAAAGSDFQWHAAAEAWGASTTTATIRSFAPLINLLISLVIFAGTLVFFFHCRRVNRKAEPSVEAPKV